MNRTMKLFTINAIVAMVSCAGITNHKSNNVWKSLAFFLSQSSSPNKVTMNLTLVGSDGKPLSIGNVSTKTMSESSDSAKPAPDSNVAPAGSGGEKSGGENIQVGMDGGSKALEIMDSNGNYAGTITMTPRTGNETHTNSFLTFALRSESEPAAGAIVGVMTGETIVLDVPFNDLTKLIPIFTHDGASVNISTDAGLKEITTGLSTNDFSSKQKYTVLAKNGTKKEYTLIVNKVKYTCELAGIYFTDYPLTAVRQKSDSNSVWYEASLPPNANLNSLKTSFSIYGTSATVAGVPQTSGVSVNNFSRSTGVTFTVNGSNGCSTDYLLKASNESVKAKSLTRGTLDLVNIPEITSVNAIGVPKTRAVIDSTASGYFDDVEGRYFFTKGQVKMMVPYGTPFSNFNLEIQTKNNTRKVLVEGKEYVKGATIVNFLQKNGNERYTVDVVLVDEFSAFEVPYEVQLVMGEPPPFLAVSKDSTFMLFVNSNTAETKDTNKDIDQLLREFNPDAFNSNEVYTLRDLFTKFNQFRIESARWTIDPGKVDLNIIGTGFKIFDYDLDAYQADMACFEYNGVIASYPKIYGYEASDWSKMNAHYTYCHNSKKYSVYPNVPKSKPKISEYGGLKQNFMNINGYGFGNLGGDLESVAYYNIPLFWGLQAVDQTATSFSANVNQSGGSNTNYNLPAPNYVNKIEPREGTVGTELTITFSAAINPAIFGLNVSMDKVPVNGLRYIYNLSGYISGAVFNVPYISKSSRVTVERIPSYAGAKFIFYSGDSFKLNQYKPIRGLTYNSDTINATVGTEAPFRYPSIESGKASYYYIASGTLPEGMWVERQSGIVGGKPLREYASSAINICAYDGYQSACANMTITATMPIVIPAPTLSYPAAGYFLTVGKKFNIAPSILKGPNRKISVDRPLPEGIRLDKESGVISGFPTSALPATTFTVSCANQTGISKFPITIQIQANANAAVAPSMSYTSTNYSLTKGQNVTITPTVTGSAPFDFSIKGLPSGLQFDSTTGTITGTPNTLQESSEAIVTVQNIVSSVQFKLMIAITNTPSAAPADLTFAVSNFTFTTNTTISSITPTYTGILSTCTSSPPLPAGLSLSSSCQITGTPTANSNAVYTITGSNASGSTAATVTISVSSTAPSNLTFGGSPFTLSEGTSTVLTPTVTGGIASCTSTPALPTGLALNSSTCAIGGTPIGLIAPSNYTITATNMYGSTNATVNLSVVAVAPFAFTYLGSPYTFLQTTAGSTGIPSIGGSPVTSCTISPALPTGLTINNTSCAVGGTPTILSSSTNYTVTATNSVGSTTASINITVNPQAPNGLSYVGSPFSLFLNNAANITATLSGGAPTSCSISPALPAGLSINNTTCNITGTPTTEALQTTHTITATNVTGVSSTTISIKVAGKWTQQAFIKPSNPDINDYFGRLGGVSVDTIVVNAQNEASGATTITNGAVSPSDNTAPSRGAVYVFKRTGINWAQEATIKPPYAQQMLIGNANVISGDTYVWANGGNSSSQTTITNGTGWLNDGTANGSGAVFVYKRTGSSWAQEAFIKAANAEANDSFGNNGVAAINGDTMVTVADGEDSGQTTITNGTTASADNSSTDKGAIYVYKRTGTIWAQEAYIKPPGFTSTALADDYLLSYGYNLAIDGDTFIIGVRSEDSDHTTITNGTTVVTNTNGVDSGAAWVFRRTGTTWAMEAFIKPSNNGPGMTEFGRGAISISGDTIAIGAAWTSSAGTTITNGSIAPVNSGSAQSGAVYVYKRTGTTWAQEAFLKAPNSRPAIYFGSSVAISGNVIAAGAYNDDNSVAGVYNSTSIPFSGGMAGAGGVYTFYRVGSSWAWESYLKSPNPDSGDYFGNNVSLSGNTLAVTASYEASCAGGIINGTTASANNSCAGAGALYVFTRQ